MVDPGDMTEKYETDALRLYVMFAVIGVALRTVLGFLRRRARREGIPDGRSGAGAIVQRFGGALNLNVHFHALVAGRRVRGGWTRRLPLGSMSWRVRAAGGCTSWP